MAKYHQTYREFRQHLEDLIEHGESGLASSFAKKWADRRAYFAERRNLGYCDVWIVGRRLQVSCPRDAAFTEGAKEISGRWRSRAEIWSFPVASHRLVMELLSRCYGDDKINVKRPQKG